MILKRLKIETMIGNYTNCYIIADEQKHEAMCIDPAGDSERILETLELLNTKLKYIYLTHCHADHTAGLEELKKATAAKILIHRIEYENLNNPEISLSVLIGTKQVEIEADARIDEGDKLHIRGYRIGRYTHTRTHKSVVHLYIQKSINYYSQEIHSLKAHMVDVTFLLGSEKEILKSIRSKLMVLPEDTLIYPGHRRASD